MKVEKRQVEEQLRSNILVSSLGFHFASYIPDWELKKPTYQKC
jgi:hypothetical protein